MQIAIKYCGGCNCTYQRGTAVKKLKALFTEHNYVVGDENWVYDIWLVVCGCEKKCVEAQKLVASVRTFIVCSEADFQELFRVLKQYGNSDIQVMMKKVCKTGDTASFSKTFYWADAHAFSRLTGDSNRLHLNYDFAQQHLFQQSVIHGILVSSLMSTVMGTQLPGEGTVLMDEKVTYKKPVYSGDTVTASIEMTEIKSYTECYIGTLTGKCVNQNQEIVAEGVYHQYMDKKFFELEEEENDKSGEI